MNHSTHHLVSRFDEAGLNLQIAARPLAPTSSTDIVQLDIARGKQPKDEAFRLWPGQNATNRIEVEGLDRALEQLVLLIDEPRRRFEVRVRKQDARSQTGAKIVRTDDRWAWIERFTDGGKRHFLCGMDEQHCFVAQLPWPVTTVSQAHAVLRPEGLSDAERRAKSESVRQGEFFFVPISDGEMKRFQQLGRNILAVRGQGIAQAARWTRAGRPHVADELWVMRDIVAGKAETIVLARGNVRHPDHRTVCFRSWMRVFQNRESVTAPAPGLLWVD